MTDSKEKNIALYEYGLVITELDPRFYEAYKYLGLNIPYQIGRSEWAGADLASDILRRGTRQFSSDVNMHMYLGFSLYYHEHKYAEAADVFAQGAKLPRALKFMAMLATRLKTHSGHAEEALEMTESLLRSPDLDEEVRHELEARLEEVRVETALQAVDRAAKSFFDANSRWPSTLIELINSGHYRGPVADPAGGVISVGPEGKATSTSIQRRLEIYE